MMRKPDEQTIRPWRGVLPLPLRIVADFETTFPHFAAPRPILWKSELVLFVK